MKKKIAILCGGQNVEHDVSLMSAINVIRDMDMQRYDKTIIYISRQGTWYVVKDETLFLQQAHNLKIDISDLSPVLLQPGKVSAPFFDIEANQSIFVDGIFPVLHGALAEDGTMQGLLEILQIAYVGCDTLSSAICMDKHITKQLLRSANIPTLDWLNIHASEKNQWSYSRLAALFTDTFFMKTVKSGSSIGVYKVRNEAEYAEAMQQIFSFDQNIIVEKNVKARELEVSVLGNYELEATVPGEVVVYDDFYTYDAKYFNSDASKVITPAEIPDSMAQKIKQTALEAFKVLRCTGMARIDFLVVSEDQYYLNEVNPLPGFTNISMYPKNWAAAGLDYSRLITKLIELSFELHERRCQIQENCQQFVTDKREHYSGV